MDYLGIDYGTKRIGLSVGDSELNFVVPIKAIHVTDKDSTVQKITEIVKLRKIHKIIIGYPINMDDTIGTKAKEVDHFVHLLKKHIIIPIERMDERLTSENVYDLRKRSSKNRQKLRKSGAIDSAAAVLILQDYFDRYHVNISY
ncbi:MAG: Holliday junction resolvase RuvX [Puniceicoccales bacterium]|jgi:putative Holliday junction resolvase|nr:Holliday junction resolvase RuvX [Puniceicoccales bacterium]